MRRDRHLVTVALDLCIETEHVREQPLGDDVGGLAAGVDLAVLESDQVVGVVGGLLDVVVCSMAAILLAGRVTAFAVQSNCPPSERSERGGSVGKRRTRGERTE